MFARRTYTFGLLGIALFFSSLTGTQLVLTLFLQLGNGFSAGRSRSVPSAEAYQQTLIVPAIMLVAFLSLTFLFPKKSREDAHGVAVMEKV